jgi:SAM-dependent methyltransferase
MARAATLPPTAASKLATGDEARAYWRAHSARYAAVDRRADPDGLTNVCKPGAPLWLNRFLAHFQRISVARALAATGPVGGLRALDFGCGTGRWARWLAGLGARVIGIDIQREALRAARDGGAAHYSEMSADTLGFRTAAFDLVISVTVLQHLPPAVREPALRELWRVVAPGGRVLIHEGERPPSGPAPALFPLREEGWLSLFRGAGFQPMFVAGSHYAPLLPWAQRAEALARICFGNTAAPRASVHRARGPAGAQVVAETARANRRIGWPTRLSVIASYPIEHLCAAALPRQAATFRTMVFRRPGGGAP